MADPAKAPLAPDDLISQADAEAGTDTAARPFSAERVAQAIAAQAATPGYTLIEGKYQASGTSLTITVPADTLETDGEHLYLEATYETAAASQVARISWDGVVFETSSTIGSSGEHVMIRGWIFRTGATAQRLYARYLHFADSNEGDATSTDAATLSGTVDIVADFASAGTNIARTLKVWKVGL